MGQFVFACPDGVAGAVASVFVAPSSGAAATSEILVPVCQGASLQMTVAEVEVGSAWPLLDLEGGVAVSEAIAVLWAMAFVWRVLIQFTERFMWDSEPATE